MQTFKGTPKGPFLPYFPHNLEARLLPFPSNLLSALHRGLQMLRVQLQLLFTEVHVSCAVLSEEPALTYEAMPSPMG